MSDQRELLDALKDTPLARLNATFNQEIEFKYAGGGHAAITGLVAGYLHRLKDDMPFVVNVGHADPAGIPLVTNEGGYPNGRRYIVAVIPVD